MLCVRLVNGLDNWNYWRLPDFVLTEQTKLSLRRWCSATLLTTSLKTTVTARDTAYHSGIDLRENNSATCRTAVVSLLIDRDQILSSTFAVFAASCGATQMIQQHDP